MKMAMEGRSGKCFRQDFPRLLNRVIPPHVWQAFGRQVSDVRREGTRWSPKYAVLCWVLVGWSLQQQLTERFRESWDVLARLFFRRRRPGRSYQGLVKATACWGEPLFRQFWACVRTTFPDYVKQRWQWYGWVVLTMDGSRIDTARTRANEQTPGVAGRHKTHPQWWVTTIVHLPTNLLWDWRQGPGVSSETSHLRQMLPALPASTLLVGDVGFCNFDLLWDLGGRGIDFLIRTASNTTLLTDATRSHIERVGEHSQVYFYPVRRRGLPPLRLRLIVLKRGGKRVYLLTNVMESTRLSRAMASELYRARWGIEVGYRSLKQTLARRKVLARTPQAGGMELAGSLLALGLLMLQAALVQGIQVVRFSVSQGLRLLRTALEAVRYGTSTTWLSKRLRTAWQDTYQRQRPKRARDWPHKKKGKPPNPPCLRRPTDRERTMIDLFWHQVWPCFG